MLEPVDDAMLDYLEKALPLTAEFLCRINRDVGLSDPVPNIADQAFKAIRWLRAVSKLQDDYSRAASRARRTELAATAWVP